MLILHCNKNIDLCFTFILKWIVSNKRTFYLVIKNTFTYLEKLLARSLSYLMSDVSDHKFLQNITYLKLDWENLCVIFDPALREYYLISHVFYLKNICFFFFTTRLFFYCVRVLCHFTNNLTKYLKKWIQYYIIYMLILHWFKNLHLHFTFITKYIFEKYEFLDYYTREEKHF